jgi:glycosyltransferase involved in cell wall biosynthesis
MSVLLWQWGRRGAGPRFAASLAGSMAALPGTAVELSLSAQAEIVQGSAAPPCALAIPTYHGLTGFIGRVLSVPALVGPLAARLRERNVEAAICAMPAPLDLLMTAALRRLDVPYMVIVHDAIPHDSCMLSAEMLLQRRLIQGARTLVALTQHVADALTRNGLTRGKSLLLGSHPPFVFGPPPEPPRAHGGPLRLLSFGRIRPYKGLDLFADALRLLGPRPDLVVRVVGHGPESPVLRLLRRLPNVTVENRWVPETEVAALLAWADALVLSYRDASQSGVAAAGLAAGRWLIATSVGGLAEQLRHSAPGALCAPSPSGIAGAVLALLAGERAPPLLPDSAREWHRLAVSLRSAVPTIP